MHSQELRFDRALFSDDVIARTAHRYSNDYFIDLQVDGDTTIVRLTAKVNSGDQGELPARFRNDALDERLRQIVRDETSDLQLTLIRAALNEALSRRGRDS